MIRKGLQFVFANFNVLHVLSCLLFHSVLGYVLLLLSIFIFVKVQSS